MQRSSVLLPEPLGPTMTSTSWAATRRSMPRRTGVAPYALWRPSTITTGSITAAPQTIAGSSAGVPEMRRNVRSAPLALIAWSRSA